MSLREEGNASARLQEAIASSTRRHANEVVPWNEMRAFLARRGIALDKLPGVRPIGIGECRQRMDAKAMALAVGIDFQELRGADQLCSGAKVGIEAAIYATKEIVAEEETEGLLLVDASNAFNAISRPATLWNCRVLWPRCSVFLFNSYCGFAVVIVKSLQADGRKGKRAPFLLLSREGTTQGCPLAMLQCAVGIYILPLITRLKDPSKHKQNWYADDSACAGSLVHIKDWLTLLHHGPGFGYFAKPTKSVIVVKEPLLETTRNLFSDLEVDVVTASRFLGGCVGNEEEIHQYVRSKVDLWTKHVQRLAQAARAYPQSCYAAFTRSLSCEWAFLQHVVGDCTYGDEEYVPLHDVVRTIFIPSVLGREVLEQEHKLFELPVKNGGLAFCDPVKAAGPAFSLSKKATELLQEAVRTGEDADVAAHHTHCMSILSTAAAKRKADQASSSERLCANLPAPQQRTLNRIVKGSASSWLTVLPLQADDYDMSATQFRDQLAIRYHREPTGLPSTCDGCGAPFSPSAWLGLCQRWAGKARP